MVRQTSPSRRYHTRSHTLSEDSSPGASPVSSRAHQLAHSPTMPSPIPSPITAATNSGGLLETAFTGPAPTGVVGPTCHLVPLSEPSSSTASGSSQESAASSSSLQQVPIAALSGADTCPLPSSEPPPTSPVPQSNGDAPSHILALIQNSPSQTPQSNAFAHPNSPRFGVLLNGTASVQTSDAHRSAPFYDQTSSSVQHSVPVPSSSLASLQCLQQQFQSQNDLLLRLARLQAELVTERASSDRLHAQLAAERSAGEPLRARLTQLERELARTLERERTSRLSHSAPPPPSSRPALLRDAAAQVDGDLVASPSPVPPERARRSRDSEAGACQSVPLHVVSALRQQLAHALSFLDEHVHDADTTSAGAASATIALMSSARVATTSDSRARYPSAPVGKANIRTLSSFEVPPAPVISHGASSGSAPRHAPAASGEQLRASPDIKPLTPNRSQRSSLCSARRDSLRTRASLLHSTDSTATATSRQTSRPPAKRARREAIAPPPLTAIPMSLSTSSSATKASGGGTAPLLPRVFALLQPLLPALVPAVVEALADAPQAVRPLPAALFDASLVEPREPEPGLVPVPVPVAPQSAPIAEASLSPISLGMHTEITQIPETDSGATTSGSGTTSVSSSQPTSTTSSSSAQLADQIGMPAEYVRAAQKQARQSNLQAKAKNNRKKNKRKRANTAAKKQRQAIAHFGLESDAEADEAAPARPNGTPQKRPNEACKRRALNRVRFQLVTSTSFSAGSGRRGCGSGDGDDVDPLDTFEPELKQEFQARAPPINDESVPPAQQHERRRHPADKDSSAISSQANNSLSGDERMRSGRLVIPARPLVADTCSSEPGEYAEKQDE